jgi:hypothetical protein
LCRTNERSVHESKLTIMYNTYTYNTNIYLLFTFVFQFSWSEADCETVMVDGNGEVYIVSRVLGGRGMFVHLPSTAWGATSPVPVRSNVFIPVATTHHGPLGGDIDQVTGNMLIKDRDLV